MPVKSIEQLEDHLHFLFFNYSLQVQYSVLYTYLGIVCLKESTAGVNRKDRLKTHRKRRTEKGTHDAERDAEKDTEQPKSSRGKQTSAYPGHSAGLQGNLNYGARGVA